MPLKFSIFYLRAKKIQPGESANISSNARSTASYFSSRLLRLPPVELKSAFETLALVVATRLNCGCFSLNKNIKI